MTIFRNIRKVLFLALWMVLGAGVLILLIAAVNIKKQRACKSVDIEINGVEENYFLDKAGIIDIISDNGNDKLVGKEIESFDLHDLEERLRKNVWVKRAELFFDSKLALHVKIDEREPVARIFTKTGFSFYIDSSGFRMPLHYKLRVRLPVFTGFPVNQSELHGADSLLMDHIRRISLYILNDEFWRAQIVQVDITIGKSFEMIPMIGNHVIEFGNGENFESKFRNLFVFYRQVLSHTGIDKYSRLNVRYDNQVIGTRKGEIARSDSMQALRNIQKMIEDAINLQEDTVFANERSVEAVKKKADTTVIFSNIKTAVDANVKEHTNITGKRLHPHVKRPAKVKSIPKKQQKKVSVKINQPKAVMPKRI